MPILAAILFRLRGMSHPWLGTQGARFLFWAIPLGLYFGILYPFTGLLPFHHLDIAISTVWYAVAAWIGLVIVPWGQWMNVRDLYEFIGMSGRGFLVTLPVYLLGLLLGHNHWEFLIAGFSMGLCYALGYYMPKIGKHLQGHTEWGEFWFGFVLGVALWLAR